MCSVYGCGHAHDRAHVDEEENLQEFSPSIIWVPRVIGLAASTFIHWHWKYLSHWLWKLFKKKIKPWVSVRKC